MNADWYPLSDAPPFPAAGYAALADDLADILGTRNDVLLIQAEAVVALEAVAQSLAQSPTQSPGRPGIRALNIVTSLYGRWFGGWLRRAGAEVVDLMAALPGQPVTAAEVEQALSGGRFDLVAVVHAESAYGILNPLPEIAALVRAHGALLVVDAVASVGGHALAVDDLGVDVAVIGPQKSLGGQAGVSALSISDRAWGRVAPAGEAPSILSLADQRDQWLKTGRGMLPGTPSALEFHALAQTLRRVKAEGIAALQDRHHHAATAARAGARALTGRAWVAPDQASNLVTAAALPDGLTAAQVLAAAAPGHALSAGVGPGGEGLIRLNHTGARASLPVVLGDLAVLGRALAAAGYRADVGAALVAAERAANADRSA
ncbi:aminotransferase class V-fold PLP-dependent enzyme [Paracoccus pacificus]|uniref:Aminotransferase class V-fold PLP-dependent enzyme n=1 Tax=Paracoccus pacificus TaxID=1463598 RepID=A0ABW4R9D6_9RHOB